MSRPEKNSVALSIQERLEKASLCMLNSSLLVKEVKRAATRRSVFWRREKKELLIAGCRQVTSGKFYYFYSVPTCTSNFYDCSLGKVCIQGKWPIGSVLISGFCSMMK